MTEYDNSNSGAFFTNEKKNGPNDPDSKGSLEVVCENCGHHTHFWSAAWRKVSKAGETYTSVKLTPKGNERVSYGDNPTPGHQLPTQAAPEDEDW